MTYTQIAKKIHRYYTDEQIDAYADRQRGRKIFT